MTHTAAAFPALKNMESFVAFIRTVARFKNYFILNVLNALIDRFDSFMFQVCSIPGVLVYSPDVRRTSRLRKEGSCWRILHRKYMVPDRSHGI